MNSAFHSGMKRCIPSSVFRRIRCASFLRPNGSSRVARSPISYRAAPEIVAELERAGRFLAELGHDVDLGLPAIDFEAAYAAQTTCYITNFAQTIALLLEPRGLIRPPEDLVEPMNVRLWAAGIDASYSERTRMQLAFNTASRGFGVRSTAAD